MPPHELLRRVQQRPFAPFRIVLTDGTAYEVRHPEMVLPGRHVAEIGLPQEPALPIADRIVTVALIHIIRLEPLTAAV